MPRRLAALLAAYRDYLAAVADPAADQDRLNRARAASRRARTDAQASVDRARAEPVRGHDQVELGQTVLAHTHRFIHAVLAVDAVRDAARAGPPELAAFLAAAGDALSSAEDAIAGGSPPRSAPRLRPLYEELAERLAADPDLAGGPATAAVLVEATDRITNSLDTLLSELRRQLGASAGASVGRMIDSFADLAAYTALPRLTDLTLSCDGTPPGRDAAAAGREAGQVRVLALGDPARRGEPARLTHSEKGETAAGVPAGRSLLFISARPDPDDSGRRARRRRCGACRRAASRASWPAGPAGSAARSWPAAAGPCWSAAAGSSTRPRTTTPQRRAERKQRKADAILHTGMPIRLLGPRAGRRVAAAALPGRAGREPRDLAPDARAELVEASFSISADGATVATGWRPRRPHGRSPHTVQIIDVPSGERRALAGDDGVQYETPVISPGRRPGRGRAGSSTAPSTRPLSAGLAIVDVATGAPTQVDLGDVNPTEWAWAADSRTLYVAGDRHGRGAVVAIDPATGSITRRLAGDAAYSNLCPAPDGTALYALRSSWDSAADAGAARPAGHRPDARTGCPPRPRPRSYPAASTRSRPTSTARACTAGCACPPSPTARPR